MFFAVDIVFLKIEKSNKYYLKRKKKSVCVLYILLRDSYQEYINQLPVGSQPIAMEKWCEEVKSPMLHSHCLLLKLKWLVLQFVRSVRSGNKSL